MKKIMYVFYVVIFVFLFLEVSLRSLNYKPGLILDYQDFILVDSLYTYDNFITDEFGIYKFSSWITDSIPHYYDYDTKKFTGFHIAKYIQPIDNLIHYYYDYFNLNNLNNPKGSFEKAYYKILQKNDTLDVWEKSIKEYALKPFNSDGFRSIAFKRHETSRPRILIIGDSFVYGMSSRPVYHSFCDVLLARGFMVYCAGIPGTDPAQYEAIAKRYVNELKPDLVITVVFTGNDFMHFPREAKQSEPHEHVTNAGFFESNPLGTYLTPKEAYSYYKSFVTIPDTDKSIFNAIASKFSTTTILWKWLYEIGILSHPVVDEYYAVRGGSKSLDVVEVTREYIKGINRICEKSETPNLMAIVPYLFEQDTTVSPFLTVNNDKLDRLFEDIPYFVPQNLEHADFASDGSYHFNNRGSLKYAFFLEQLIRDNMK